MNAYVRINVVRRITPLEIGVYRCLQSVTSGQYMVQSFDHLRVPVTPEQVQMLEAQFYELLSEALPDERGPARATLAEAISAFDEEFGS